MSTTSFSSVLIITAAIADPTVVRRQFQLNHAPITQISTLEEFDHRFTDDHFDMIIVDREMLMGPTNSTMADLQMLSRQSSSLVITEPEKFVDVESVQPLGPENFSVESNRSNQHLDIISQSVRCISHENRNVLQRVQIRLDSLERTLKTNALKDHDVQRLKFEFGAVHELFETTRMICNPIKLNMDLVHMSEIVEETVLELLIEFGQSIELELLTGVDDLVWMDLDGIKMVISKLFQYLLAFTESPSLIHMASSVGMEGGQCIYRLSLEAESNSMGQRPNELIDLAIARRIVLLHDGKLDITTSDCGKTVCALSLPLG